MVAYVLANGIGDSQGDFFRRWLWQLTHNEVVGFSSGRPRWKRRRFSLNRSVTSSQCEARKPEL